MAYKSLKRNIFQRIFGISATKPPKDPSCWSLDGNKVTVDLGRATELSSPGGSIRLEGQGVPHRLMIFHGDDGEYHAFRNHCGHAGRRLDPVPGEKTVQCCSINHATYDYEGKKLEGPGKKPMAQYPVQHEEGKIVVELT